MNNRRFTESTKSINEKNVAKFVDELNRQVDEKIHYRDAEAEAFTKKYGKLFNFKYRVETDENDNPMEIVVYDALGMLDLFEDDSLVRPIIDRLARKNGWYVEPYSCSCDFTFGEL